jgi:S1-C subfamily serine protease
MVDTITFTDPAGTEILGTGIILSATGLVLTDYHVIRDDVYVGVRVGGTGEVHPAEVVVTDPDADLALLQIQDAAVLRPAELARTSSAAIGDPILAIGNARGLGRAPEAVRGHLVALDLSVRYGIGSGTVDLAGMIEAAAPIFAGDSGGALVDATGRVIGLIAAGSDDTPCAPEAVCPLHIVYAIPIHAALTRIGYTAL